MRPADSICSARGPAATCSGRGERAAAHEPPASRTGQGNCTGSDNCTWHMLQVLLGGHLLHAAGLLHDDEQAGHAGGGQQHHVRHGPWVAQKAVHQQDGIIRDLLLQAVQGPDSVLSTAAGLSAGCLLAERQHTQLAGSAEWRPGTGSRLSSSALSEQLWRCTCMQLCIESATELHGTAVLQQLCVSPATARNCSTAAALRQSCHCTHNQVLGSHGQQAELSGT